MPLLLLTTLLCFVVGIVLPRLTAITPSAPLHLILALGIMPLIFGAMIYFVPVLTRSGSPEPKVLLSIYGAMLAGVILTTSLLLIFKLYLLAAVIALLAVAGLSYWMQQRARQSFGSPHPGLLWYRLALLLLGAALVAIILASLWPQQWLNLRRLHLHLNILGFVGLTALGTLRVLLPTVGSFQDMNAGPWLMHEWRLLFAGTLLIAVGAAWFPPITLAGLLLWLIPLGRLAYGLLWLKRRKLWLADGAAPSLATASIGLIISLLLGAAHGLGWLATTHMSELFILMFLMPLVSGAATHLLPLWLWPGAQTEQQNRSRTTLGRFALIRSMLFQLSGMLLIFDLPWSWLPAMVAMAQFLSVALWQTTNKAVVQE
ncbi:MAG: hypothetical protein GY814_02455 [Gammaproteobacteria bacterium]|nr:hypothetical protein [Gammaproteobacteria bacterium]